MKIAKKNTATLEYLLYDRGREIIPGESLLFIKCYVVNTLCSVYLISGR